MIFRTRRGFLPLVNEAVETGRWTFNRKEALLRAIQAGEISEADAIERYALSAEELASWSTRFARLGEAGLKIGKLQVAR